MLLLWLLRWLLLWRGCVFQMSGSCSDPCCAHDCGQVEATFQEGGMTAVRQHHTAAARQQPIQPATWQNKRDPVVWAGGLSGWVKKRQMTWWARRARFTGTASMQPMVQHGDNQVEP